MYKKILITFLLLLLITLTLYNMIVIKETNDQHIKSKKIKGVAITLYDINNNDSWYDKKLPKIKKLNAQLEVVTPVYIKSYSDSYPINDPNIENKLKRLVKKCKQYNVDISLLKPHLMTRVNGDNIRRPKYNPSQKDVFFSEWSNIMGYYASVCKKYHIPIISITCETSILTGNTYYSKWHDIIKKMQNIDPSIKITAAYTKYELNRELSYHEAGIKSLSNKLNYIGFNMYPEVKRNINITHIKVSDNNFSVKGDPYGYVDAINRAYKYFGKKILITETGASSLSNYSSYYISPFVFDKKKYSKDHVDQNRWEKVVLSTVLKMNNVKGVFIWHIDKPFQFMNSPSEKTIKLIYNKY